MIVLGFIALAALLVWLLPTILVWAWNGAVAPTFGLPMIDWSTALMLIIAAHILFPGESTSWRSKE